MQSFVGAVQLKSFSQIFKICLSHEDLELICSLTTSGNSCWNRKLVICLLFCGCSTFQPIPGFFAKFELPFKMEGNLPNVSGSHLLYLSEGVPACQNLLFSATFTIN